MALGLGGCGSASHAASQPPPGLGKRGSSPYRGDGDYDNADGDPDNNLDTDSDAPYDYLYYHSPNTPWNRGYYHDRDDLSELAWGQGADKAEARAITSVVLRYYSAASRDDGRRACEMLLPSIRVTIKNYRLTGIPYVRGTKTCPEAMDHIFRHYNLSVPQVTNVRVAGNVAAVLWGSRTMAAGYITLIRRHRTWIITAAVGNPLF